MVKVLSVLVLVFSIVQSSCEVYPKGTEEVGDLTIHCGHNDTSIVNITYYGDISLMFIEDKYEECSSEEISPAHHIIYNINNRDCGFIELNNTNTWTVTVRLQKGFLVTTADKKVNLVCVYDDDVVGGAMVNSTYDPVQPQQINKINTENIILQNEAQIKNTVVDVLTDMINGHTNLTVEVLDNNREQVSVLYPDDDFRLRITFPTVLASTYNSPIVKECKFSSPSQEHLAYLIHNGCGNIRFTSLFDPIEISEVNSGRFLTETAEFKIPKIWLLQHDSVSIFCEVIVCKKPLQCSQLCPLPIDTKTAQKDDILKIGGRTGKLTLLRIKLPATHPPVANVEKLTGASDTEGKSYMPYLIIAIVLVVLLIVLTAILICVIREQIKSNQGEESEPIQHPRPIVYPVLQPKKKKTKITRKSKSWFKTLRAHQINGVGYPCLIPTNDPNQPYQLVNQPLKIVNKSETPSRTQHYFVDPALPGPPPPQTSNFENQTLFVNHPLVRSNSFQSNIGFQPFQTGILPSVVNQPFQVLGPNPSTQPMHVVNSESQPIDQPLVRSNSIPCNIGFQSFQTGILPSVVNQPLQVVGPNLSTQPVHVVNSGFPYLASVSPQSTKQETNNDEHEQMPKDSKKKKVEYHRHYYPPPRWTGYDEPPADDPRFYDPYFYRDVYDWHRRREEPPHCYNRPLARTTSLIDVMGSVLHDDRRRSRGRRYFSAVDMDIPRPPDRYHEYYETERPRHYDYYDCYDPERPRYRLY